MEVDCGLSLLTQLLLRVYILTWVLSLREKSSKPSGFFESLRKSVPGIIYVVLMDGLVMILPLSG